MKRLAMLISTLVLIVAVLSFQFFVKVKVDCKSQYGNCSSVVASEINKSQNKSLYLAKTNIKKIIKSNLQISNYSFQYKLPNILVVNLIVKKPSFSIFDIRNNQSALLDSEGNVLSITQDSVLPQVQVAGDLPKVGEKVSNEILFALHLQSGVFDMYQIRIGEIVENRLTVVLPSQIKVIFPLQGDVDILLGSLRLVYAKIESGTQTQKYSEIDLRFKNPVLR